MLRGGGVSAAARAYAPDLRAGGGVDTPEELHSVDDEPIRAEFVDEPPKVTTHIPDDFHPAIVALHGGEPVTEWWAKHEGRVSDLSDEGKDAVRRAIRAAAKKQGLTSEQLHAVFTAKGQEEE